MNLRIPLVLVCFAAIFIALTMTTATRQSATWDEPQHLVRGYLGWHGDHRLDPEHPPFLRLWAAIPLLYSDVKTDTAIIDQITPTTWVAINQFHYCHLTLYKLNDADQLLNRARFMIVLLGLLLGGLLFAWTYEWLGFWPAVGALALYCFEPNILAHSAVVTTDLGLACFMFGTLYFLWRTCRQVSAVNLLGLAAFFTLAVVSKFTALLLGPMLVLLLAISVVRRQLNAGIALGILVGLCLVAWLAIWTTYGFRYLPSNNPNWSYRFQDDPTVVERTPTITRWVAWSDSHRLLPNAFTQGFLLGQAKAKLRGAFLFGENSTTGWWYYFPVAFLIKTPIATLLLVAGGLVFAVSRWRKFLETPVFLVLPIALYLGIAMSQRLNIGLRHILPLYPLALMLAAVACAWLLRREKQVMALSLTGLVALEGVEFARVYPHPLAFFNTFVGGPGNGYKFLADSNLDWGQDLKALKQWMTANQVPHINLAYFGTADPEYYQIQCTHLPGAPFFAQQSIRAPQLPGYVAVSVTILNGCYNTDAERAFYKPLLNAKPVATLGHSIRIYHAERPWWQ